MLLNFKVRIGSKFKRLENRQVEGLITCSPPSIRTFQWLRRLILNNDVFLEGEAPGSPIEKPASKSQTKGKWLKLTRKGLLVSAISRVGKKKNFLVENSKVISKIHSLLFTPSSPHLLHLLQTLLLSIR